ncbi:glutamate dehydrogenase [Rickettsia conorii subsp. heilongjiangensis]|uniref:Glutamate dehydrogenase n=1 Tax=Rickettsia conorii subsp. heilongjiangensis TaxID=226665 RepID=A0AAD1LT70_RICCR|nr:NAD-glutamate dehydrogenase [Rickettsia conorii]AEK75146.1 NAD-specific glutamate dehydrogenase [Rickettsia conorii subsp. heilongjiangensis 054]BBM91878.1 glutamate dehydrogenase [Rickettsia conorii subsp. heilongjiangensis]BBM93087.1 glutamate dehydrogenase [Rickettsia conorii subsp. heilongjiangensis]BBM94296.1 glutamate dehydrogenase [Rickettsia conorii subsp. heilongjiangensis]BBM95505.1 glutamate dehydrogenase [Rickettsia conorii subsp. heilongjiangensis]
MTPKTTSLNFSRLNCQIPNYKTKILELSKERESSAIYIDFVQKFLNYIPIDYDFENRAKLFQNFADEAFKFFKHRIARARKIAITKVVIENDPAINVLILLDNKPHIVDFIICLLKNMNLQTKFLLHPVINCVRNSKGELEKILENSVSDEKSESILHLTILGNFDDKTTTFLTEAINERLEKLEQSYSHLPQLLTKLQDLSKNIIDNYKLHFKEAKEFLNWLQNDNLVLLGTLDFEVKSFKLSNEIGAAKIWQEVKDEIDDIIKCSANPLYQNQLIILGKINSASLIHSDNLIDYILVKKFDSSGEYISGSIIFGIYNSNMYYHSISNIPILRQKFNFVIEKAGFALSGYNADKLRILMESLPREALIQIDQGDLYCMCLHMLSSMMSKKLKLFIQYDWSSSFLNIIIFLPRERLTAEMHNMIDCYLAEKFGSKILSNYITEVAGNFSYLFVTLEAQGEHKINFEAEIIQQDLDRISTRWSEDFYFKFSKKFGEYQAGINLKLFDNVFSADYRQKFSPEIALVDIEYLTEASKSQKCMFNLVSVNETEFYLKIYSPKVKLALSNILPPIENLGFKAIDEQTFAIKEAREIKESWIYNFILTSIVPVKDNITELKINVEEALDKMALGMLANDSLSKLIVLAGFNWKQVKLVKALTRYLHQTGFSYGKGYVQLTLLKHPEYTKMLVNLFDIKFNPKHSDNNCDVIKDKLNNYLVTVEMSSEDKVLRNMLGIVNAITRTNYYQPHKHIFSFKFDSSKVPDLPKPVPFAEAFVYSRNFEAVHLRGGPVSRGGLRWSDRAEDYRLEVLGLMKAQMTKNSVIVPVGSKGGFYVHFTEEGLTRDEYMEKVVECYKNFLRGLLDITDNIIDGKVVHPKDVIIYDKEDPYLVVAADKGTASFSDYANSVAREYNYWLDDAFASGGSAGYDHKKMAITSKGAWISVTNHFKTLGLDVQKDPITVVGIGDMSGDVFGNGMLRSEAIKLVAAFNHKHIFIDPTPDPLSSFNERLRLFNLKGSNWSDYDSKLISKGGKVFERSSKLIKLSPEIKKLLDINDNELSPEELIKAILKADVDLLWNGGIGTYIKAKTENNLEIGDKANDNLRCDGEEIRAKVIAEGGNVGVSQRGRVEYAKKGGRINADFIDNSAGVDCSDHEVNIKIALSSAITSGKITLEERNKLLNDMTKQVEELVLLDNYKQTEAITIMQLSPTLTVNILSQFIDILEEEKVLERENEFLPSAEELNSRAISGEVLTRPELCILLSYSKRSAYHELINSTFSHDKYFDAYLIDYFPEMMQKKFRNEILSHPLKHEIIKTVTINKIMNQLGGPLISIVKREIGAPLCDIIRSYTIICEIFDLDDIWETISKLPTNIDYNVKIDMFTEITKLMRRGISWFIKNLKHPINISETIEEFRVPAQNLRKTVDTLLVGETKIRFEEKLNYYTTSGVEESLAATIATFDNLISVFDIIYVTKQTSGNNKEIAKAYFVISDMFSLDWLRKACDRQLNDSFWRRLGIQSLKDDLYDKQRRLLIKIINKSKTTIDLDLWIDNNNNLVRNLLDFIKEIKAQETIDLNIIILANKKFEIFLQKLE